MSSCDVVEPDADVLEPSVDVQEKEIYVLSDGASFIDLQSRILANQPARISITSDPRHGTLADLGKGMLQYSPSSQVSKARDGFEFTIYSPSNEILKKDSVIIIIEDDSTNLPCNLYPVTDYIYSVGSAGVLIDVTANDVICSDSVVVSVYKTQDDFPPYAGTAVVQGNKIRYTPGSSFTGADKLMYKLTDIQHSGRVAYGMVYITNDSVCVPAVHDDHFNYDSLAENSTIALSVFANDSLCDALNQYQVNIVSAPQYGTVSRGSNGYLYRVPDSVGYSFQDQFSYEICIDASCKTGRVDIKLLRDSLPDCKILARPDSFDIKKTATSLVFLNVLKNDSICGGLKTFTLTKKATSGTTYINQADNTIAYKPDPLVTANDSIRYQICGDAGCSATLVLINRTN